MAIWKATRSRYATATAGWPLTWIHGDFYPTNVLLQSPRVTGIVDFEFAGAGHRALDVAIGLNAFALGQHRPWPLVDHFLSGYLNHLTLTQDEIDAIPTLILTREATSLMHWLGRYRKELTGRIDVEVRSRRLLHLARFVDKNGADLVKQLRQIGSHRQP